MNMKKKKVDNSKNKNDEKLKNKEKKEKIKIFITELIRNYIKLKNYNVYQTLINLETSIQESEKKSSIDDLFKYNLEIYFVHFTYSNINFII